MDEFSMGPSKDQTKYARLIIVQQMENARIWVREWIIISVAGLNFLSLLIYAFPYQLGLLGLLAAFVMIYAGLNLTIREHQRYKRLRKLLYGYTNDEIERDYFRERY